MARNPSVAVTGGLPLLARIATVAPAALIHVVVLMLPGIAARGDEASWYLMERHGGCVDLSVLTRRERLPRAPTSPQDFAQMMRARGHRVTVGPLPNAPPALAGKAVLVDVRDNLKPIFVQGELCRQVDK